MVLITARDVTDHVLARREAEDARETLEPIAARLRLAQEAAGIGTWEWDADAHRQAWSPQQFRLHGLDPDLAVPPSFAEWIDLIHPEDRKHILSALNNPVDQSADRSVQMEFRIRRADTGADRWLLSLGRATRVGDDGRPRRTLGVNLDITERRNKQAALEESEALLRLAAEAAEVHAWAWDMATNRVTWADGLERALGLSPGGFDGTIEAFRAMVHPDDRADVESAITRALSGETGGYRATFRMIRADGSVRWTETRGTVVRNDQGRPLRLVGMDHDITDLKVTEAALQVRERQQAAVARLGQFALETSSARAVMNEAVSVLTGTLEVEFAEVLELSSTGEFLTLRAGAGWSEAYPIDVVVKPATLETLAGYTLLRDAGPVIFEDLGTETRFVSPALLRDHGATSGMTVIIRGENADTPPYGVLGVHTRNQRAFSEHDVRFLEAIANLLASSVQREQAEALRSKSEAQFRALAEAMPQMIYAASAEGFSEYKNRQWFDYSGQTPEQAYGGGWTDMLHPADRAATLKAWHNSLATGQLYEREHRLRRQDGEYRWFLSRAVPLRDINDGRITRWLGTSTDISDIVAAREVAAEMSAVLERRVAERTRALTEAAVELQGEMRRRQDMQSALLQSQKLEALGQLTAGVAHDFNNVLSAIKGSFELIEMSTEEPKLHQVVLLGMNATRRAISLTRQLLDFGRSESLVPSIVDVAEALGRADAMIGHAIGRSIDRDIIVPSGTWRILTDGNQLEVALLNLAINARDAMPQGGGIVLAARNLAPSERPEILPVRDYVSISLKDSGEGMPPDVLARATEPFFTTKPSGKGTGLGLPMVHAFALRSGGCLRIESREGSGTTVEIVLPRAAVSDMELGEANAAAPVNGGSMTATILVVEDDEHVRGITVGYLQDQGYNAVGAANAEAAIAMSHSLEALDLLVTDVAMPGAGGPELAARLRAERPDLPVLFISGFAERDDLQGEDVLLKPFSGPDLIAVIRRRLNRMQHGREDGLLGRLKNPVLVSAYLFWRALRNGNRPPRLPDLDWGGLPDSDHAFIASVDIDGNKPVFRYLRVGRALTSRLGRPLEGTTVEGDTLRDSDDEVLGSLESAYRRCATSQAPTYEYARYNFGDGTSSLFERLILPVADDGETVTHLLGVALFTGDVF